MLEEDLDVALVTDAGTPCISDPGSFLAKEAAAAGIEVLAVPGPTAMASALSVSGFDTREFAYYGFLPRQKRELSEKLLAIARTAKSNVEDHVILPDVLALEPEVIIMRPGDDNWIDIDDITDLSDLYKF